MSTGNDPFYILIDPVTRVAVGVPIAKAAAQGFEVSGFTAPLPLVVHSQAAGEDLRRMLDRPELIFFRLPMFPTTPVVIEYEGNGKWSKHIQAPDGSWEIFSIPFSMN